MPALLSQDATMHLHSVVHSGATHDRVSGQSDRGASVIRVAIVHRGQFSLDRADEAHRTRLLVDIEPVAFQCGSSHPTTGDADSVDLSVGGRVQCFLDAVGLSGDDVAQGINDDRSEGGIAASCSEFRLGHREANEVFCRLELFRQRWLPVHDRTSSANHDTQAGAYAIHLSAWKVNSPKFALASVSTAGPENRLRLAPISGGPLARFEDDHGRLCRAPARIRL